MKWMKRNVAGKVVDIGKQRKRNKKPINEIVFKVFAENFLFNKTTTMIEDEN